MGLDAGNFNVGWPGWVFVPRREFLYTRINEVIVPRSRNVTILNETKDVTRYTVRGDRIVNNSISVDAIEKATGQKVTRYKVSDANEAHNPNTNGKQITFYRPKVSQAPANSSPPKSSIVTRQKAVQRRPSHHGSGGKPPGVKTDIQRQQEQELQKMEQRHRAEQDQLKNQQSNTSKKINLQKQQTEERQALQRRHTQERHVVQNRRRFK